MENIKEAQEKFLNWLKEDGSEPYQVQIGMYNNYLFLKNEIRKGIKIVYAYSLNKDGEFGIHDDPKYQCLYMIDTETLYDIQYDLSKLFDRDEHSATSFYTVNLEYQEKVRNGVNAKVMLIEDKIMVNDENREKAKYYAEKDAREIYLRRTETDFKYSCNYESEGFHRKILDYLTEPDKVVRLTVDTYYKEQLESIKNKIIMNKVTEEFVREYEKDENAHLVCLRNIISAVPESCQTVNVTTVIGGEELTFKCEASQLRSDYNDSYYTWHIPATDRRKYEEAYGKRDFRPEDITRITYSRKVLYERGN